MTGIWPRQPASNEVPPTIPKDAAVLAPPRQRAMPQPAAAEPRKRQRLVQEGGEPQVLILFCCLTYPLPRLGRVVPARSPGRVLREQVPFGQTSSLHPLRCRLPGIVRGLLRYYRSVRPPRFVRRRASLNFLMRPRAITALGNPGISRFLCEVSTYMHGFSDRAGLPCTSRYRCTGRSLPLSPTASAPRSNVLTRLNTLPARSPIKASTPPSWVASHDSGPKWVATSPSYDFFIHYTRRLNRRTGDIV
jgi:hypothetical protein